MKNQTYNGWTNYATWRINLELFDNCEQYFEECEADEITAELCKEYAEDVTFCDLGILGEDSIAVDYARAFLDQVNWHEISNFIKDHRHEY